MHRSVRWTSDGRGSDSRAKLFQGMRPGVRAALEQRTAPRPAAPQSQTQGRLGRGAPQSETRGRLQSEGADGCGVASAQRTF